MVGPSLFPLRGQLYRFRDSHSHEARWRLSTIPHSTHAYNDTVYSSYKLKNYLIKNEFMGGRGRTRN